MHAPHDLDVGGSTAWVTDLKSFCRIRGRLTFGWTVDNAGQDQASDGNILAEATR